MALRLRTVIVLFFTSLLLATELVAWLHYRQSMDFAREEAEKRILAAGDSVELRTRLLVKPLASLCDTAVALPGAVRQRPGFSHESLDYLLQFMESSPAAYSAYFGYGDGGFLQVINTIDRGDRGSGRDMPPHTRFALRRIALEGGARVERWRFLDRDLRVIGVSGPKPALYDPRARPWFKSALKSDGRVNTDLYTFSSTGSLGMTMARRTSGASGAVFGLDLTLDTLSLFLRKAQIGQGGFVFLFDADGDVLAHPDQDKLMAENTAVGPSGGSLTVAGLNDPVAKAVFERFRAGGGAPLPTTRILVNGQAYLAEVRPMQELSARHDFMAIIAREADFMVQARRIRAQALGFGALLLVLGVPLLFVLSNNISRTLKQLTEAAERISRLDMGAAEPIHSHIDEVNRLGEAVANMRMALSSSCRYLPRSLVRYFLKSGAEPTLGGERRDITLLFTDVQDFTKLSEAMPPEELMNAMTEYFELVGQAILKCDGTIDKFIGDAVMAFWNAPLESENHVESACLAALRLSRDSEELNARRAGVGGPIMHTRVGIHTGTAVVGNVGASDRMNYTALGSVVNMASRLEGLNKFYSTRILVSHEVRDRARRNFLFRSVDVVAPKGVKDPVAVFELVGGMPACPHKDVAVTRAQLGFCSRWERAIALYRTVQWPEALSEFEALAAAAPDDFLAAMYLQRVVRLLERKPGRDWKAVQRFMHK
jgi:adenylate cyclase